MKRLLEVCANSARSCVEAQKGGAMRVELCAGIPEGGTTPSYGEIVVARKNITIDLNVIIRPRGGDFLYNSHEIEAMIADIDICKKLGANGVVFGCLTKDGEIDTDLCHKLINATKPLSATFHRAFDVCRDPMKALEQIIELGFDRILTSGCRATAPMGAEFIAELIRKANGKIIIMPGCGVNESNIDSLEKITGAKEFHASARSRIESQMKYRNGEVSMGGTVNISEFHMDITDADRVKRCVSE